MNENNENKIIEKVDTTVTEPIPSYVEIAIE